MSVSAVRILLESHDPDGRARHTMVVKQSMVRDMMKEDTSTSLDRAAAMLAGVLYLSRGGRRHLDGQEFEQTYAATVVANATTKDFPGVSACFGEETARDLPPGWEVPIWVVSWAETEVR